MTGWDLAKAMWRRWPVVLIGLALTFAALRFDKPEVVYWAEASVTVVAPPNPVGPKTLEDVGGEPIPAASMLIQLINAGRFGPKSVSPDATLYGEGKRSAVSARLHDAGGQWGSRVDNPIIDIQAVDDDDDKVKSRIEAEQARLRQQLDDLQNQLGVVASQRLSIYVPPTPVNVWEVTGSRARASASTLLLGMFLTVGSVYEIERRRRRPAGARALEWKRLS